MMSRNLFQNMLMHNEIPALVMFYEPGCPVCQSHIPVLEDVADEFPDRLQVIKVNVDRNIAAALRYSIRATPTFLFFYKGNVLWQKQAQVTKDELLGQVQNLLSLEGVY